MHADRYARADEFLEVVTKLWDSWEDEALVADAESGLFADTDLIHSIDHVGQHFSVAGPLNTAALAAGPAGLRAGRVVGGRPGVRRALGRGDLHRAPDPGQRPGVLPRREEPGARERAQPRPGEGAARDQPVHRVDHQRGRGAARGVQQPHPAGVLPRAAQADDRRRPLDVRPRRAVPPRGRSTTAASAGSAAASRWCSTSSTASSRRSGSCCTASPAPAATGSSSAHRSTSPTRCSSGTSPGPPTAST